MKKYLLILLLLLPLFLLARPKSKSKFKVKQLTAKKIPSEVEYPGDVVQAIQWEDKVGDNIIVLTETAPAQNKDRPEKDLFEATLDGRHYVLQVDHWRPRWSIHDQVHECNLEIAANFVGDIELTDLDEDGIAEVWILYRIGCHGPERPSYMKIVMYESEIRYSIKGLSDATIGEKRGDYSMDPNFTNGPAAFREYATDLWNDNITNERRLFKPGSYRY